MGGKKIIPRLWVKNYPNEGCQATAIFSRAKSERGKKKLSIYWGDYWAMNHIDK